MSAEGTAARAEGAEIDAAAEAAATAATAANAAIAASADAAANAQEVAAERTAQLEERVAAEVTEQKDELAWLRTHATETQAALANQSSALTTIAERQAKHEAITASILERLTPPASPETREKTPEEIAAEKSAATKENRADSEQPARPRNRWI